MEFDIDTIAILVMLTIILVGLTFAFLGMQLIKMHNQIKKLTAAVDYEPKISDEPDAPMVDGSPERTPTVEQPPEPEDQPPLE